MNNSPALSHTETPLLLIVGASTRAAATSALRAGYRPLCVDQYGDRDLLSIADVIPRTSRMDEWLSALAAHGSLEWIYTGAVENQQDLITQLCEQHRLRGCEPGCLQRVRDPFFVEQLLSGHPIRMAPCLPADAVPPDPGNWLCKPLRSAAGQGIRFLDSEKPDLRSDSSAVQHCYLQRYQPGQPLSALFMAFPEGVVLVGLALQLVGHRELGAAEFQFCGGITISPVPARFRPLLEDLGTTVAQGCGLKGLFGCDLIWAPEQPLQFWLTEVNPRYTSLTELFELQYRLPLLSWHLAACRAFAGETTAAPGQKELERAMLQAGKTPLQQISKGILYTCEDRRAPEIPLQPLKADRFTIPESADLPCPDTLLPAGTPFCSVYGVGRNQRESLESLWGRIEEYRKLLSPGETLQEPAADALTSLGRLRELEKDFFCGFFSSGDE